MENMFWDRQKPIPFEMQGNARAYLEGAWDGCAWDGVLNIGMWYFQQRKKDKKLLIFKMFQYCDSWESIANKEMSFIRQKLEFYSWFKDVQHVGSTAIKGIAAKPTMELMVGYDPLDENINLDVVYLIFRSMGYIKENEVFYNKCGNGITISFIKYESKRWNSRILFRDYLRENPQEIKKYNLLKLSLLKQPLTLQEYTKKKQPFFLYVFEKLGWSYEDMVEAEVINISPDDFTLKSAVKPHLMFRVDSWSTLWKD